MAGIAREQGLGLNAIEIWFADEARVGQKNGITRRWARRGTRPSAPQDQRYASTYIFGAVCPQEGKGAALVLPVCNTAAMNRERGDEARLPARWVDVLGRCGAGSFGPALWSTLAMTRRTAAIGV